MAVRGRVRAMRARWGAARARGRAVGPRVDETLAAGARTADEQAAERAWEERVAHSRAEVERSCKKYGWWWPP